MPTNDIPRRRYLNLHTPMETAIYRAIEAVENGPADPRLTEAQTLLAKASDLVADYVDERIAACPKVNRP